MYIAKDVIKMSELFQVAPNAYIVCRSENTSYGFRHLATLYVDGSERETAKACYHNRTWEKFQYETVLLLLLEKTIDFTEEQKAQIRKELNNKYGY
jgi:hypothetical protein